MNFLDFEKPIAELEAKINSLTEMNAGQPHLDVDLDDEIARLKSKSTELIEKTFSGVKVCDNG